MASEGEALPEDRSLLAPTGSMITGFLRLGGFGSEVLFFLRLPLLGGQRDDGGSVMVGEGDSLAVSVRIQWLVLQSLEPSSSSRLRFPFLTRTRGTC